MPSVVRTPNLASLADYPVLLTRVRETFVLGQQKAEELKVRTYWEAGRLIHEHLEFHREEAGYGTHLMARLARGLGVGDRLLYRMLSFYEAFPDHSILSTRTKLTWSHYRTLAQLPDKKQRLDLQRRAARESWTVQKLDQHVSSLHQAESAADSEPAPRRVQLLEPIRGQPGLYRIVPDGDGWAVDLGFASYQPLHSKSAARNSKPEAGLTSGSLVTLTLVGDPVPAPTGSPADLYTYAAEILHVVDGDTLWLKIWLKPDHWVKEKVRLRGLDCPELDTPEGQSAKRFVETLARSAKSVTVTTTKPDKWDRYLSDVFLRRADGEESFLNNLLLEKGHARRYDKVTPADWDEAGDQFGRRL